jgi:hypothetical protein
MVTDALDADVSSMRLFRDGGGVGRRCRGSSSMPTQSYLSLGS